MAIERRTATGSTLRLEDSAGAAMDAAAPPLVQPFQRAEYATYFAMLPSVDEPLVLLLPTSSDHLSAQGWERIQSAFAAALDQSMDQD